MTNTKKRVPKDYKKMPNSINTDLYKEKTNNLDLFLDKLVGVQTDDKWSTWGRDYIQIPPEVLLEFGIISNLPLVAYVNYVINESKFYCYPGEIFSGDAAWFDYYKELDATEIKKSESYKKIKNALEQKEINFFENFNTSKDKWNIVPILNPELAKIASILNKHIK